MAYGWAKGSSRRWRAVRAAFLAAHPFCQPCLREGRREPATEVHHRVPLSAGGARFSPANLVACCSACHRHAHGAGRGGCDVHGFPLR